MVADTVVLLQLKWPLTCCCCRRRVDLEFPYKAKLCNTHVGLVWNSLSTNRLSSWWILSLTCVSHCLCCQPGNQTHFGLLLFVGHLPERHVGEADLPAPAAVCLRWIYLHPSASTSERRGAVCVKQLSSEIFPPCCVSADVNLKIHLSLAHFQPTRRREIDSPAPSCVFTFTVSIFVFLCSSAASPE